MKQWSTDHIKYTHDLNVNANTSKCSKHSIEILYESRVFGVSGA